MNLVPSTRLRSSVSGALFNPEAIGLNVVALISDQGSTFTQFVNDLGVTADKPHFEMSKQCFTNLDPLQLPKNARNNVIKYDLGSYDKIVTWAYKDNLYEKKQSLPIRTAQNLLRCTSMEMAFKR